MVACGCTGCADCLACFAGRRPNKRASYLLRLKYTYYSTREIACCWKTYKAATPKSHLPHGALVRRRLAHRVLDLLIRSCVVVCVLSNSVWALLEPHSARYQLAEAAARRHRRTGCRQRASSHLLLFEMHLYSASIYIHILRSKQLISTHINGQHGTGV